MNIDMRTIIHISDLHFGRVNHEVLDPLAQFINTAKPDVVVVSGDLTQRAYSSQFFEAKKYLELLPGPKIVIPGNHDIPLYNIFLRFIKPMQKYQEFISSDLGPIYRDEEMAVIGINTSRSFLINTGVISLKQVKRIRNFFELVPKEVIKIVVTHHPFDHPENYGKLKKLRGADEAIKQLALCGVDLFLAGHLHMSHIGHSAHRYKTIGHSALIVQAGTATSNRTRAEAASFNSITIHKARITVAQYTWDDQGKRIVVMSENSFCKEGNEWVKA